MAEGDGKAGQSIEVYSKRKEQIEEMIQTIKNVKERLRLEGKENFEVNIL
jgi:hypothetical protein